MEKMRSEERNAASSTVPLHHLAHLPVERDTAEHYRGYLSRQLVMNRCADCQRWHHPMRPMCPACWSGNVEPTPLSGRGTVHLFMLLHQGPPADGVDYSKAPHPVVTVDLSEQEGLRFTSTMVDCPLAEIRIGMPVEMTWIERNGSPYPAFRPVSLARKGV
jgi:uncharacterized protein